MDLIIVYMLYKVMDSRDKILVIIYMLSVIQ